MGRRRSTVTARRGHRMTEERPVVGRHGCGEPVLWLRSESTGVIAPINRYPEPGGYCEVDVKRRTYVAHPTHIARGLDPTTDNPDANPTLYRRHFDTCPSPPPPVVRPRPSWMD